MVDRTSSTAASSASPWHEGERVLQEQAGVAAQMEALGQRLLRTFMPDQHRQFFAQLPFLVVGSVDAGGWPWASLLHGAPGFATSPDPQHLDIAAHPTIGDPLAGTLQIGSRIGLLGIELPTRRRNRMNGQIVALTEGRFSVAVEQSFGNCAQYIQARDYEDMMLSSQAEEGAQSVAGLDAQARRLIRESDTFFVASAAPRGEGGFNVDVSHRGGRPGFVRIEADDALTIPDYAGNRFFNTLGNLHLYPRAGLTFIDFSSGDVLQLTGPAEILSDAPGESLAGAERFWRVRPSHGRWLRNGLPLRFSFREMSPASLRSGIWSDSHGETGN